MIQSLIAKMGADLEAAKLLCWSACRAEDDHLPKHSQRLSLPNTSPRELPFVPPRCGPDQGASGCHESSPVARYYRGAKIMEIIEGTTQVHEVILGKGFVQDAVRRQLARRQAVSH